MRSCPCPGLRGIEIRSGLGLILLDRFSRCRVSPVDLEDRDTLVRPQHVEGRAGAIDHEGNGDHKKDHDHREGSQDGREDTPADDRCTFRRSLLEGARDCRLTRSSRVTHRVIVSHARRGARAPRATPSALSVFAEIASPVEQGAASLCFMNEFDSGTPFEDFLRSVLGDEAAAEAARALQAQGFRSRESSRRVFRSCAYARRDGSVPVPHEHDGRPRQLAPGGGRREAGRVRERRPLPPRPPRPKPHVRR